MARAIALAQPKISCAAGKVALLHHSPGCRRHMPLQHLVVVDKVQEQARCVHSKVVIRWQGEKRRGFGKGPAIDRSARQRVIWQYEQPLLLVIVRLATSSVRDNLFAAAFDDAAANYQTHLAEAVIAHAFGIAREVVRVQQFSI